MSTKIGIIDYGMGNLHSVKNAMTYIGCDVFISDDKTELSKANGLILPGVGAFPDAMNKLKSNKMDDYVKNIMKELPLMGICLGMQLLFDKGYEFEECDGLGIISGDVIKIKSDKLKIPHIGWNELTYIHNSPLIENIRLKSQVYFVHSYKTIVHNRQNMVATTEYGDEITAIVGKDNVFGCQFHPEKSGAVGLKILENFRRIVDVNTSGN